MKEKKIITYEQLNKRGICLTGFTKIDNVLRVKISRDCGPYGLALYIALLSHHNRTEDKCFPSIDTLARETGISNRKVSDVLNDLLEFGYIIIRSGGTNHSNSYWFPHEDFYVPDLNSLQAYRRKNPNPNKKKKAKDEELGPILCDVSEEDDSEILF